MASMTIKQRLAMIGSGQHQDLADIVAADALKEIQRLESAIASLPVDGGEVDYDTNDPMGVEKDIQSSDGGEQRKHENTLCSPEQQSESRPGPSEATPSTAGSVRDDLLTACRNILPYLRWTIGPESPGHHPTMPSAVAALESAYSDEVRRWPIQ